MCVCVCVCVCVWSFGDVFFVVIPNQKLICRSCTRDGFVEGPINGAECDVQSRTLNMNCIEYENMPLSVCRFH